MSSVSLATPSRCDNVEKVHKEKTGSKVRIRALLGRLFNNSSDSDCAQNGMANQHSANEISGPYNTVHRIHVCFVNGIAPKIMYFRLGMMDKSLLDCHNHGWKCYSET